MYNSAPKSKQNRNVQGEGDYRSAERFNKEQKKFVHSGRGERLAEKAGELRGRRKDEAEAAEKNATSRAREKDPQVKRDYRKAEK